MKAYNRTTLAVDLELVGCLELTNNRGNYLNLLKTLELHIALCYSRDRAIVLVDEVIEEACTFSIPEHEYILNEVQYERRIAMAKGEQNLDHAYEKELLDKWVEYIKMKHVAMDPAIFLEILMENRQHRTR